MNNYPKKDVMNNSNNEVAILFPLAYPRLS